MYYQGLAAQAMFQGWWKLLIWPWMIPFHQLADAKKQTLAALQLVRENYPFKFAYTYYGILNNILE